MSDDIIKMLLANAQKEKMMQELQNGNFNAEDVKKLIVNFAPTILAEVEAFEAEGGRALLSMIAEEGHQSAVDFISTELPMVALMLKMTPKEQIAPMIAMIQSQYTTEKALEQVASQKQQLAALSEDQHIELYQAYFDTLPEKMRNVWMTLYDINDKSEIPDLVRTMRDHLVNTPEDKLAEQVVGMINLMSADEIYGIAMDLAEHFSADGAQKLTDAFNKHVQPETLEAVMNSGLDLAKEFLQAASSGTMPELDDLATGKAFTDSLKDVLQAVEDAIVEGDAVPPALKTWAAGARGAFLPKP